MNKATCQSILSDRLKALKKEFEALNKISESVIDNVETIESTIKGKELNLREIELVTKYITETCESSIKVAEEHENRMIHLPLRLERALSTLQKD